MIPDDSIVYLVENGELTELTADYIIAGDMLVIYTDEFGVQTITDQVKAYIGVKGDANLDGTADAKDAAAVLIYAAAIGAGQDAPLYSDSDAASENLAFFLAEVNSSGDADAKDAAAILEYSAAIGSGEPKTWDEVLGAA